MKKLTDKSKITEAEWLEQRKKTIGASEIAKICGVSRFGSPLSVYMDKIENVENKSNIAMKLGIYLEPFLREETERWFQENEGIKVSVRRNNFILADDEHEWMTCNLDGEIVHPIYKKCPVELKTSSEYYRANWEDDKVPDDYYYQVQWQLMITQNKRAFISYLIGNRSFDVKLIERDDEVIKTLRERAIDFRNNYLIPQNPPAPSATDFDRELILSMYPEENKDKFANLNDDERSFWEAELKEYYNNLAIAKSADDKIKDFKNRLMFRMGEAQYAEVADKLVKFETVSRKGYIVEDKSYRSLSIVKNKLEKK